jgi:hypothetical protein
MSTNYQNSSFHRGKSGPSDSHCSACGQPMDEDVRDLAAMFLRQYPDWSSRRCFDRAYIAACKGAKPERERT